MKKTTRRISTDSIELALEQLIRARTAKTKASIKPVFVIKALKELVDRRREEKLIRAEVDELFDEDIAAINWPEDVLRVVEVESLSELGNSSHGSTIDLSKVEWKKPEKIEEPQALDESDVIYEVHQQLVPRSKHSSGSIRVQGRWEDGSSPRRVIILALLVIIALTFIPILVVF